MPDQQTMTKGVKKTRDDFNAAAAPVRMTPDHEEKFEAALTETLNLKPEAKTPTVTETLEVAKIGNNRSPIEQRCDQLAEQSHKTLDEVADLITSKINALRKQLDDVEAMMLKGTADAKARVSDQMALIAKVADMTTKVHDELPELRRLVSMEVPT